MRGGSRKYNKIIEVWQVQSTPDAYSGNYADNDTKIADSWACVETLNKYDLDTLNGVSDAFNTLKIKLLKRNDLTYNRQTMYFKYRDVRYDILNEPINLDFTDSEIVIYVIRVDED
jgi:hypothetical protein